MSSLHPFSRPVLPLLWVLLIAFLTPIHASWGKEDVHTPAATALQQDVDENASPEGATETPAESAPNTSTTQTSDKPSATPPGTPTTATAQEPPDPTLPTHPLKTPEERLIQERLHQAHINPRQRQSGHATLYTISYLPDLYQKNDFAPLWTNEYVINQLLTAIIESADEGLTPTDYHLKSIVRYSNTPWTQLSLEEKVDYDLLLSDAFLLLEQHKRSGKVDPGEVAEKQSGTDEAGTSIVDASYQAIKKGMVRLLLDQASPQNSAYKSLKGALKWYREIADQGGWPRIPNGQKLRPGMHDTRVPLIRERLKSTGDYKGSLNVESPKIYTRHLVAAVKIFQQRHHLDPDGVIGPGVLNAMNVPVEDRIKQIQVNLERIRWLMHDIPSSRLIVDIAAFSLRYYNDNDLLWTSKVMVGQPFHQTPVFRSAIKYIVLNPTWTITPDIIKNETVPSIIKSPGYLSRQKLHVLDRSGHEVNPSTISWGQYLGKRLPYTLRQEAGKGNALGQIKFLFPNPYHVYLHDTPSKSLFGRSRRAVSHGCIRVQNPLDLGRMILANDPGGHMTPERIDKILASGKTTTLALKQPLPVFLMYLTTHVSPEGQVMFKPDLYDRDDSVFAALTAPPTILNLNTQLKQNTEIANLPNKTVTRKTTTAGGGNLVQNKEEKPRKTDAQGTL